MVGQFGGPMNVFIRPEPIGLGYWRILGHDQGMAVEREQRHIGEEAVLVVVATSLTLSLGSTLARCSVGSMWLVAAISASRQQVVADF